MEKQDLLESIEFIYGFEKAHAPPVGSTLVLESELKLAGMATDADHETICDAIYEQVADDFMETIVANPDLLAARRILGDEAVPTYVVRTSKTIGSILYVALYMAPAAQ